MENDSPISYRNLLIGMKWTVSQQMGWSLFDIDETDFCNLLAFINYNPENDPNVRIINGKKYHKTTEIPDWL